jgi:hypothetical protein
VEHWAEGLAFGGALVSNLAGGLAGLFAGAVLVGVLQWVRKMRR